MTIKDVLKTKWPNEDFVGRSAIAARVADILRARGYKYNDVEQVFLQNTNLKRGELDEYLYYADTCW